MCVRTSVSPPLHLSSYPYPPLSPIHLSCPSLPSLLTPLRSLPHPDKERLQRLSKQNIFCSVTFVAELCLLCPAEFWVSPMAGSTQVKLAMTCSFILLPEKQREKVRTQRYITKSFHLFFLEKLLFSKVVVEWLLRKTVLRYGRFSVTKWHGIIIWLH